MPTLFNQKKALRLDLFANGDGSAFYNNLPNQPDFVFPVQMNQKDYQIYVELPDYLQNIDFEVIIQNGSGHTSAASCKVIKLNPKQIFVSVPWKTLNLPNTDKFHQTIFLVPKNQNDTQEFEKIIVKLTQIKRRKSVDFFRKPQLRIFANIHQNIISSMNGLLQKIF